MNNQRINFLVATKIMGREAFPGSTIEITVPGMFVMGADGWKPAPAPCPDYLNRIDLAFDVAGNIRERVSNAGVDDWQGLHSLVVGWLTLVDAGTAWVASFYDHIDEAIDWWGRPDEFPYTAKHENPAAAIVLAACLAMGINLEGERQ